MTGTTVAPAVVSGNTPGMASFALMGACANHHLLLHHANQKSDILHILREGWKRIARNGGR